VRAGVNGYFEKKSSRTWTIVRRYFPDEKSVGEIWLMFLFLKFKKIDGSSVTSPGNLPSFWQYSHSASHAKNPGDTNKQTRWPIVNN
jgi:hypothetical protein